MRSLRLRQAPPATQRTQRSDLWSEGSALRPPTHGALPRTIQRGGRSEGGRAPALVGARAEPSHQRRGPASSFPSRLQTVKSLASVIVAALCVETGAEQTGTVGMKQARKEAVRRLGGLLYNDDGVDYQQPRTPAEFIAARLGPMANTQVGLVTLDPLDVDNIAIYPSKVLQVTKYPLLRAGHDPIAVALEFCHSHNLQFFPSFRMNDVHESRHKNWARTAIWKRENPHCLLGKHGDDHRYPMSSPRAWWAAKDYAVAEVRDRQFLVIEEMCEMYDLDGVELDWLRSPLFFEPTMDLEPVAQ